MKYYSLKETAEQLNMSIKSVEELILQGKLTARLGTDGRQIAATAIFACKKRLGLFNAPQAELYTVEKIEELTGIGKSTLYRGIAKKAVKGRVVNGVLVFTAASINKFIYSRSNDMRTRHWRPIAKFIPNKPMMKPVQGKLLEEPRDLLDIIANELGIEWGKPYGVEGGKTVKMTKAGCFTADANGSYQADPEMFKKLVMREVKVLGPIIPAPVNPKKDDMVFYFDCERDIVVGSKFNPRDLLHVLLRDKGLLYTNENFAATGGREGVRAIIREWGEKHDDQRRETDKAV